MQSLVPVHKQLLKFELVRFAVPCESAEHPWGKHNQAIVQGSLIQPNHKFDHNQKTESNLKSGESVCLLNPTRELIPKWHHKEAR